MNTIDLCEGVAMINNFDVQNTSGILECEDSLLRNAPPEFSATPEAVLVREMTLLSQKNFSIDTHFYPLGSCTMKYNPRIANQLALWPGVSQCHPLSDPQDVQGLLSMMFELQQWISALTGFAATSLAPMAGAQGEFAGVAMIRAYHEKNADTQRTEILIPDAAHGTNPASAAMCGYKVKTIATGADGDIDLEALRAQVGPQTAGIMLTNPSTLGVFERKIKQVSEIIHDAGGLLYYDGANLNAILGRAQPAQMGFDVMHLNTHKTFATPHGGGGPGSGPIACVEKLIPFLPVPRVIKKQAGYDWLTAADCPDSIGRLSAFSGNIGVLVRAWVYLRRLGIDGVCRVSETACLNANYLMRRCEEIGYTLAYPERRASHEFLITLKPITQRTGVTALDVAKRLLDYGFHAPTIYFPLMVPECLLIEPTETESKASLDAFIDALEKIKHEIETNPEHVKQAPHSLDLGRLDEVLAARQLDLRDE